MKFDDAKMAQIQSAVDAGATADEISARFGVHIKTAKIYLRNSTGGQVRPHTDMSIIRRAIEDGATAQEISTRFGVCLKTAKSYIGDWCRQSRDIKQRPAPKPGRRQTEIIPGQAPLIVREWIPEYLRVYLNRHPRRNVEYAILEVRP